MLKKIRHSLKFRDEDGITTVSMAVCIFLSLTLIFSGAQLYRVSSASSEIQEVADAAALAAENEVAEFVIAVKLIDAVHLSLTLLSVTAYGIGVVSLCAGPECWGTAEKLIETGHKVHEERDRFAQKTKESLTALMKALPFLAAANAANVANNNNSGAMNANYLAVAMLVPSRGYVSGNEVDDWLFDVGDLVDKNSSDIKDHAFKADEYAKAANEAKTKGFMSDCGNSPAYCMMERASHLAGLSGASNPSYSSADAWSFSVALSRAKSYYSLRASISTITGSNAEAQADSVLRKRFYEYASQKLASGYVHDTGDSFECDFPLPFKNTAEMKETDLYTEAVYPVTVKDNMPTMHAWSGCPGAEEATSFGSISQMDAGGYETCPQCKFKVSSLGTVAAASSSINNGFEYHYRAVAQAASEYEEARKQVDYYVKKAKTKIEPINNMIARELETAGRLGNDLEPPGANGAIAMVVNTAQNAASTGFESSFVGGGTTLGTRAAVAGSTLLGDSSDDGANVITSLLDGLGDRGGAATGGARVALDCWSSLLKAYQDGQSALTNAVRRGLSSVSTNTESGIGTWAARALEKTTSNAGLEPVDLKALKPVLINTGRIAVSGSDAFCVRYSNMKQQALSASNSSTDLFSSMTDKLREAINSTGITGRTVTIATIDFPLSSGAIPITITLPEAITDPARGLVDSAISGMQSITGKITGVRSWQ